MQQIKFKMDGYTFAGYVRDNSFWTKDLTTIFHSLEDVSERDNKFVAVFTTAGSPGNPEDGCHEQTCSSTSCIQCRFAKRENCEQIVPFGLGVKLGIYTIKPLPELGAIKDAYAKPLSKKRQHRKHNRKR